MKKMKSIITNMTVNDWIQVALWLLTLIMLFVFVIVAAIGKEHPASLSKDSNAITGLLFVVSLCSALLTTVFVKFFEKRKKGDK